MSLIDWLSNTVQRARSEGLSAITDSARMVYVGSWRICCSRLPLGTNIYTEDWDLLILLDGCRVDIMRTVASEFEFITQVDELWSVGSTSREWLAKTFSPEWAAEVGRTTYITANPYTSEILTKSGDSNRSPFNPQNWKTLSLEDFGTVDEAWREAWSDELGTVPPRQVTDRTIQHGRQNSNERIIVHYMQPHQPFIGKSAMERGFQFKNRNCWRELRRGQTDPDEVWQAYEENLRLVLEDVGLLLKNIEAGTVVISSDHGNAFGEWGIYGHPNGFIHPVVKRVPWVVTEATDTEEYEPTLNNGTEVGTNTEDRLHHLGYI